MNTKRLRSLQSACDTWPSKLLFYRKRWTTFARASLAHLCLPSRFNHLPWAVSLTCWMSSTAFSLFKSGNCRDFNNFCPKTNLLYFSVNKTLRTSRQRWKSGNWRSLRLTAATRWAVWWWRNSTRARCLQRRCPCHPSSRAEHTTPAKCAQVEQTLLVHW